MRKIQIILLLLSMTGCWRGSGNFLPDKVTELHVDIIHKSTLVYYEVYGELPDMDDNFFLVLNGENSRGIKILPDEYIEKNGAVLDGWGEPIKVIKTDSTNKRLIWSFGPNKKDDGKMHDDIIKFIDFNEPIDENLKDSIPSHWRKDAN